jgi:two-component system sensor histidine kinase KdpD
MATNVTKQSMINKVAKKLGEFLNADCDVILARKDGTLKGFSGQRLNLSKPEKEMAVAYWVFDNQKPAGWSTETLAAAEALYLPLKGGSEKIGVLVFQAKEEIILSPGDQDLLYSVARQLSLFLEKEIFRERASETERLQEIDRMHRTILNLISEEIRMPISVIIPLVKDLSESDERISKEKRKYISDNLFDAIERLKFTIDNLLTMSRITIGIFPLQKEKISAKELVESSMMLVPRTLGAHQIIITEEPELPPLNIDINLMQKALANLLVNASLLSPKSAAIEVDIKQSGDYLLIEVRDHGEGILEEERGRIFEKFYQVAGKSQQGIGLGLAVAKGIVKAHGGKISADNDPRGGARLKISLPLTR